MTEATLYSAAICMVIYTFPYILVRKSHGWPKKKDVKMTMMIMIIIITMMIIIIIITQNIKKEEKWMQGQFPRRLHEQLVDKEQSCRWLKFGYLKGETESTIVAAQDQAINTNYFKRKILKGETESRC
jgi:hypothetical protein